MSAAVGPSTPPPGGLQVSHLRRSFGRRQVVTDVSFAVAPGEVVGLLGPNGAGKTTSFNMVAGLIACDAGAVHLGGYDLANLPLWRRVRRGLGYLPQEPTVFRGLTAHGNLLVVLEGQGVRGRQASQQATAALATAQLGHVADVAGSALSGGERRRLEMARALLCRPQILLLDEPFAGVDPIAVGTLKASIRQVASRGIGVLVTDHNAQETLRLCDRVYLLAGGQIVAQGSPAQIVACPKARAVYLGEDFHL